MDKRQAKKIGYLVLGKLATENSIDSHVVDVLKEAGLTDGASVNQVLEGISAIGSSLSYRGLVMNATGGGGTQDISGVVNNLIGVKVTNPQNVISVPNPTPDRVDVSDAQMEGLVRGQLDNLINAEANFTAYDVTKTLREINPSLNIGHERVRAYVHYLMHLDPDYVMSQKTFPNGAVAIEWVFVGGNSTLPATVNQIPVASGTTNAGGLNPSSLR